MKKIYKELNVIVTFVLLCILTLSFKPIYAIEKNNYTLNQEYVKEAAVYKESGNHDSWIIYKDELPMFSVKKLAEKLAYSCKISAETATIKLINGDKRKLEFKQDCFYAILNDNQRVILDVCPIYKDGDIFLSAYTLNLCFDLCVDIDKASCTVNYTNDKPAVFNRDERFMTRADSIIFIMLAIGARSYGGTGYENMYDTLVHDGISEEWYDKCICHVSDSYLIEFGARHAGIIYGEHTFGENNKYIIFNDSRFATLQEITAFMIRCLKPDNVELNNLNSTFAAAKECGLIKETDSFYGKENIITLSEFKTILKRFLQQPRGIYHSPLSPFDPFTYKYDNQGSKTYSENLKDMYSQFYEDLLLGYDGSEPWDKYITKNLGSYDIVLYCV